MQGTELDLVFQGRPTEGQFRLPNDKPANSSFTPSNRFGQGPLSSPEHGYSARLTDERAVEYQQIQRRTGDDQ